MSGKDIGGYVDPSEKHIIDPSGGHIISDPTQAPLSPPKSPSGYLVGKEISAETIKVALEAVKLVYKFNVAWLQTQGREKEYTRAMDELEAAV